MSAFDLRNISENFRVEILSNVISVTNMSRERVTQNFIPMKLKGLQAEKCRQEILFNKIVAIILSCFLNPFSADMSPFYDQ